MFSILLEWDLYGEFTMHTGKRDNSLFDFYPMVRRKIRNIAPF